MRPPGYEPGELPTAPLRGVFPFLRVQRYCFSSDCASFSPTFFAFWAKKTIVWAGGAAGGPYGGGRGAARPCGARSLAGRHFPAGLAAARASGGYVYALGRCGAAARMWGGGSRRGLRGPTASPGRRWGLSRLFLPPLPGAVLAIGACGRRRAARAGIRHGAPYAYGRAWPFVEPGMYGDCAWQWQGALPWVHGHF